jgi:hypothetical protein
MITSRFASAAHLPFSSSLQASSSSLTRMMQMMCPSIIANGSRKQTLPPSSMFRWRMLTTSSTASGAITLDQPLRRRRRRTSNDSSAASSINNAATAATSTPSSSVGAGEGEAFAPKDSNGNLLTSQEYLKLASLSPWVPCPDIVIKRVLEIANASNTDIHGDLGCGDGRLNFAAVSGPFHLSKSWGVDIDTNILEKCQERLDKRFVPRSGDITSRILKQNSEAERLEFHQADLIRVIERQKEKYQSQLSSSDNASTISNDDWSKEDSITEKISTSTIITMYFVNDALKQMKPYLESTLGGKSNVRVVTIGYEMYGWDATWVERVLGLTIFKYDMGNVSNEPAEWKVGENDEGGGIESRTTLSNEHQYDLDYGTELSQLYLQQKRAQDIEELNAGLRIHHDEKLNEFAQARFSAQQDQKLGAATMIEDWENEDGGWDFDETEDPEDLLREVHKTMENARNLRGKGIMAGLDIGGSGQDGGRPKPIWKKP